ncbi:RNA polymerase sigma factor [Haloferula sargassicola]|uniref:RNA polymerase sigma-70 region 2 domain-containing protein n=1 Tax=Haloferula sargassicola TaxID=490096 RepID=A0ABP9UTD3_9BACT
MPEISETLLANLDAFTGFARSRLGDADLARDAVQDSLLKAITAERQPSEEAVVPWFYRILRRTIIDLHRRHDARNRALDRLGDQLGTPADPEEERVLCCCFERLLPDLPESYAELIRRIDLGGERASDLAAERGSNANALTVQHHRARRRLRDLLEGSCKVCASHGCLDCDCAGTDH